MAFILCLIAVTLIGIYWAIVDIREEIHEFVESMYEYEEMEIRSEFGEEDDL